VGQAGWRALQIVRSWQISLGESVVADQANREVLAQAIGAAAGPAAAPPAAAGWDAL